MKAFPPRPYHFYGLSYWRFWTGPLGKKKNQGHPDQKRKIKVLACRGHVLINTFKTLVVEHVGIRWQTLVADHAEILEAHVQNQCPGSGTGSPASRPVRGPSAAAGKTSLQRDHLWRTCIIWIHVLDTDFSNFCLSVHDSPRCLVVLWGTLLERFPHKEIKFASPWPPLTGPRSHLWASQDISNFFFLPYQNCPNVWIDEESMMLMHKVGWDGGQ